MSIKYSKIMRFLARGNKTQFDIPVDKQLDYIFKMPEPKNDFERSFCQYKAQMLFVSRIKRLILNMGSLISLPWLILFSLFRGLFVKEKAQSIDVIVTPNSHQGVIPDSVQREFNITQENVWVNKLSLSSNDIVLIKNILRFLIKSPYFCFKLLYKLSLYSNITRIYRPKVIIVFNEFSFTSSVLTNFCELNGVEHIDIMHGEKLLFIRDSFFRFSRTYVWEKFYVELFDRLRASKNQFIVEIPPFMKIDTEKNYEKEYFSNYKYYLGEYTEKELKAIILSMTQLTSDGTTIKYRPHPRYSNLQLLKKYVSENQIEYPTKVGIMTSVASCNVAIGTYTTVLNQAVHSGKDILIDDVNFPYLYKKLYELDYILLKTNTNRLSEKYDKKYNT